MDLCISFSSMAESMYSYVCVCVWMFSYSLTDPVHDHPKCPPPPPCPLSTACFQSGCRIEDATLRYVFGVHTRPRSRSTVFPTHNPVIIAPKITLPHHPVTSPCHRPHANLTDVQVYWQQRPPGSMHHYAGQSGH